MWRIMPAKADLVLNDWFDCTDDKYSLASPSMGSSCHIIQFFQSFRLWNQVREHSRSVVALHANWVQKCGLLCGVSWWGRLKRVRDKNHWLVRLWRYTVQSSNRPSIVEPCGTGTDWGSLKSECRSYAARSSWRTERLVVELGKI